MYTEGHTVDDCKMAVGKGSLSKVFRGTTDLWFESLVDELLVIVKGGDSSIAAVGVRRKLKEFAVLGKRLLGTDEKRDEETMKKFKKSVQKLTGKENEKRTNYEVELPAVKKFEMMLRKRLGINDCQLEMSSLSKEKSQRFIEGLQIAEEILGCLGMDLSEMWCGNTKFRT